MNIPEVLEKAADSIDQYGHWNGGLINTDGRCIITSIGYIALTDYYLKHAAYRAFAKSLHLSLRESIHTIAEWNDAHSHKEVTSAMRACAAMERARLQPVETETV